MGNSNDGTIEQLAAEWPNWEFWVVHRLCGGPVFCCRRKDDHKVYLNADSVEHLNDELTWEVSG